MDNAWHALPVDEACRRLSSGESGLDSAEAARRLARDGPNRLELEGPVPAYRILLNQFASLVVVLLLAAAAVAVALGDLAEAVAIGAVLLINTLIGFFVELRARRTMDALLRYEVPTARVVRDGELAHLSADLLVAGDLIELEEGDHVPADARLITASELHTNESPLTGESLPVGKNPDPVEDPQAALADRTSMVYSGTSVAVGRASALVVGTGADSEIGRIGALLAQVDAGRTPLEIRLDALARRLIGLTLGVAAVVTTVGALQGAPLGQMIETGLALAIAAFPEGLPAVATIALAVGLRRMAAREALVRRLSAVEALGATTVVCTDKTGTLTAGEMTVVLVVGADQSVRVTGSGFSPEGELIGSEGSADPGAEPWLRRLLEAAALTSRASFDPDSGELLGDPTDGALSVLALKGGVEVGALLAEMPQVRDVPFSSARRASASVHARGSGSVVFIKGAPETVFGLCTRWAGGGEDRELDTAARAALEAENQQLAEQGLRVIGLASGEGEALEALTFLGLVGIADPPADGVPETIARLRLAGIRTVMITGDQDATAEAISRDLGIMQEGQHAVSGAELSRLSDRELGSGEGVISVFSRTSPQDKLRVVSALQAGGEIVAMLGDGVNDAAALKKADVGVAMGGRGTDVAKETSDIVLRDDRFVTIGAAVEEGRVIFDNIRKFVFYLFSCNLAEVLCLLVASIVGLPLPLLPLQILWLNLVTDTFPALALAMEPAEPGVMNRPPRDPDQAMLSRSFLGAIAWYAALITVATLAAYIWALRSGDGSQAVTIAFMTLALAQLFHLGNARSRGPVLAARRVLANRWALAAIPLVLGLQLAAVYWAPLTRALGTVPLATEDWLVVLALSALPALVGQGVSLARSRAAAPDGEHHSR